MRARTIAGLTLVAVVAGIVAWLWPDGNGVAPSEPTAEADTLFADWTIEDARAFDDFELYWLGDEFMGHKLRGIVREKFESPSYGFAPMRVDSVSFIYGECTPDPAADGSCALPIGIHVNAYCTRPPALLAEYAAEGPSRIERGVLAQPTKNGGLSAWTGGSHIDIQTSDGGPSADTVWQALRDVDTEGLRAGEALPVVDDTSC